MMKKLTYALLLVMLLGIDNNVFSQQMTPSEITEYMTKYKWFLRRYEWKDQFYTTPKEYQGTYLVFLPQGKMYYHKKGEKQSDQPQYDWKLTGDRITFTSHEGIKGTFKSNLKDFIGYKIYISVIGGQENGLTYVWERAGEVQEEDRVGSNTRVTSNGSNAKEPDPAFNYATVDNLVDSLNKLIRSARINFQSPSYSFSITGSSSTVHSSIRFFAKNNQLYISMHMPANGNCETGNTETKARLTGQYGSGGNRFYIAFRFKYACNANSYETIYANFYWRDKRQHEALISAVKKYCADK